MHDLNCEMITLDFGGGNDVVVVVTGAMYQGDIVMMIDQRRVLCVQIL